MAKSRGGRNCHRFGATYPLPPLTPAVRLGRTGPRASRRREACRWHSSAVERHLGKVEVLGSSPSASLSIVVQQEAASTTACFPLSQRRPAVPRRIPGCDSFLQNLLEVSAMAKGVFERTK